MSYFGWGLGLLLSLSLTCACGGSAKAPASAAEYVPPPETDRDAPIPAVHKRGAGKLIAVVGPAGGTLELDNGARLVIPEGALGEAVEVTFAEGARTTAFSNHEYEKPFGPTLEVACEANLAKPVEVSVPDSKLPEGFSEKDLALGLEAPATQHRAIEGQGTQTRWDYLDAHAKAGRAVAELAQVPGYRVQFIVSKSM